MRRGHTRKTGRGSLGATRASVASGGAGLRAMVGAGDGEARAVAAGALQLVVGGEWMDVIN